MNKKLESNKIIIFSAAVVLLFIAILASVNLYFLDRMNTTLSTINETYNKKLDIITHMSRIVRDRSLTMLNMHLTDDFWLIDKQYLAFHQMAVDFILLREQLKSLQLTIRERAALNKALDIIKITDPLQDDIVERIHSGIATRVKQDITEKDMPLENELWDTFNALTQIVRNNAQIARREAKNSFKESIFIVISVALILALLVIMLKMRQLRKIQNIESRLIDKAESLGWEATHDPLTNAWNRRFLKHKVELLVSADSELDFRHVLIYLDLDNFKPINDTYGHMLGDKFLKAISETIVPCIRKNDILARLGGDEFAVLLENCSNDKAREIAECIQTRVKQCTVTHDGDQIPNDGCSIGIASFGNELSDFEQLLRKADAVCYAAKRSGKNKILSASSTDKVTSVQHN